MCNNPSTSVVGYLNDLLSTISLTEKTPLYAEFATPAVLLLLVTFLIVTLSLTFKLWGRSVKTVTRFDETVHVLINLGFLPYSQSSAVIEGGVADTSIL